MAVLFVAALEEESVALRAHVPVLHLGIGKVPAAVALATHLAARPHDVELVVSLGTAGGLKGQRIGHVEPIARVEQHDVDHAGIEAIVGRAMPGGPLTLPGPDDATGRLVTGDRLVAAEADRARLAARADVVDMEGYAVAAVCDRLGVPLWMAKAVSDGAGDGAIATFKDALERCADALAAWADERGLLG